MSLATLLRSYTGRRIGGVKPEVELKPMPDFDRLGLPAASCFGDGEGNVPSDGACTGQEQCGTVADCPALCATVGRLGCAAEWGIDAEDGACLDLCETASTGLCPALAAQQATCEEVDRATECQK